MTTMLRIGSYLMMILMTAPMVRDCCLPVTHVLTCHESKHQDDEACFSGQQAIAEAKGVATVKISFEHSFIPVAVFHADGLAPFRDAVAEVRRAHPQDGTDLYLRTGALLI